MVIERVRTSLPGTFICVQLETEKRQDELKGKNGLMRSCWESWKQWLELVESEKKMMKTVHFNLLPDLSSSDSHDASLFGFRKIEASIDGKISKRKF